MLNLTGLASRIVEGNELTSLIFLSKTLPSHFHAGDRNAVYLQQSAAVLFVTRAEETLQSLNSRHGY